MPAGTKQQLENLAEVTESDIEDDSYLQQIEYLKKDPLDINKVRKDELQVFPFLTDLQIDNFIRYRSLLGAFISVYELQSIPTWDVQTIYKILPFVRLGNDLKKEGIRKMFAEGEQQVLLRGSRVLEKAKGFDQSSTNPFLGDRNHWLLRYRYQYKNLLQYGTTADKDAGEPFFKNGSKRGFDFYSAHLFARNLGVVKSLAIGDFTVNLGQGLIHWQSLAFKKSAEVMAIKRQSAVLRPYSSAGEFYFSRGAGITLEKGRVQTTLFASYSNVSANLAFDTIQGEVFSSFLSFGLHRNASEIKDRNSITQTSVGGNVAYHHPLFKIGLNAIQHHFSKPFQKQDKAYNLYAWTGNTWSNASIDYSTTIKNIHFFGEAALDKRGGKALVNGAMISLDPKLDLSILHRHIDEQYQSVSGNAFTENILPSNENGLYLGIVLKPLTSFRVNAYADLYRFPWLKYRVDAPSEGKDFLLQATYQPNKQVEVYTRYRSEHKQINDSENNFTTNNVIAKPRQNWRVHFSYQFSPKFIFRNRVDIVWYDARGRNKEQGYLIFAEGHYKPSSSLSMNARLQYFETEGYNSRIYAYENDVLYSFSVPAFSGKGLRYYFNLNHDLNKKCAVWFRWAQTILQDQTTIGSAISEIDGNKKSEIKLQLLFRL